MPTAGGWASTDHHEHLEQFNQALAEQLTRQSLNLTKPYRKLVAIRSPYNLGMLEKCLAETDPGDDRGRGHDGHGPAARPAPTIEPTITDEDRQLLTAVVTLAEHAGKPVQPLIVPTNEPFYALTPDGQDDRRPGADHGAVEQVPTRRPARPGRALLAERLRAKPEPLSIRVLGKDRDVRLDIAGGSQIPKPGAAAPESAQLLAELRKSWHGVERLLLAYDGSPLRARLPRYGA